MGLLETSVETSRSSRVASGVSQRLMVCAALLALLMIWAAVFPQTGDGDAIMHYLNARDGLWQPAKLMGSWARVGSKIPLLIPAQFGVLAARWAAAVVSILGAWQTVRLAEDLKLKHALLAAPFLIFQPFVFSLAGDTMTELPLALGIVVAIRLWMAGRIGWSCWVMGYLPTVRPEGFFLCAIWAAMLIANKRPGLIAVLGWGALAWIIGCRIWWGDATYFFRAGWAWPADSLREYGRGSFFAYLNRWPIYSGPVLFILFLAGVGKFAVRSRLSKLFLCGVGILILELILPPPIRENVLPWSALALVGAIAWEVRREKFAIGIWVFLLIFTLHSVLWSRGWFGSCGLMRILACAGPITAIACVYGWNAIEEYLPGWIRAFAIAIVGITAMVYYVIDPLHQRIFPLRDACQFIAKTDLLRGAPMIVFGDPMAQAALNMAPNPPNLLKNDCDRAIECERLSDAPLGTAGLWDNQHAQAWFGVSISDLAGLGYTILYRTERQPRFAIEWLEPTNLSRDQVYVVVRKDRAGAMPGQSHLTGVGAALAAADVNTGG